MDRELITTLPDGVFEVTSIAEAQALGSIGAFGYFARHSAPSDFPGTEEAYDELRRIQHEKFLEVSKDWSCGKAVRVSINGVTAFEPADAMARVSREWSEPKLKELGIVLPNATV